MILGLGWTFPCDIWSVGCILVELATGRGPPGHQPERNVGLALVMPTPPFPLQYQPMASQHVAVCCSQCQRAAGRKSAAWRRLTGLCWRGCLRAGDALYQTHENLEHLAMMEAVLGPIPEQLALASSSAARKFFVTRCALQAQQPRHRMAGSGLAGDLYVPAWAPTWDARLRGGWWCRADGLL